ncbi:MAG: hypothetical protein PHS41_06020 [Victivallaceae bacterium]|nr:hypothetical protein [Victivallaceae bacterium]
MKHQDELQVIAKMQAGDFSDAEQMLNSQLASRPRDSIALMLKGVCRLMTGDKQTFFRIWLAMRKLRHAGRAATLYAKYLALAAGVAGAGALAGCDSAGLDDQIVYALAAQNQDPSITIIELPALKYAAPGGWIVTPKYGVGTTPIYVAKYAVGIAPVVP